MNFNDIEQIKESGFRGFSRIGDLFLSSNSIPNVKGVYFVLYLEQDKPKFVEVGSGGYFKGKNPNISIEDLDRNWVTDAKVIYIGKAGGESSSATLKSRLDQYLKFGQGKNIGHYGGRLIWQIKSYKELVICWKPLPNDEPRKIESELIQEFTSQYRGRPFANLQD